MEVITLEQGGLGRVLDKHLQQIARLLYVINFLSISNNTFIFLVANVVGDYSKDTVEKNIFYI